MKNLIKFNSSSLINEPSKWVFKRQKHGVYPVPIQALNFKLNVNWDEAKYKKQGHKYFDLIWKRGLMERNEAYWWLSNQLGIKKDKCHFSLFDHNMCIKAIQLSVDLLHKNGKLNNPENGK